MYRILLTYLFWFPVLLSAQRVTVSEPISIRNDVGYELIGDLEGRILLFQDRASTFQVQAFDDRMQSIWEKELVLDGRRPTVLGITEADDHFSLLYYYRNSGDYFLKVHTYDAAANLRDSATLTNLGSFLSLPQYEMVYSDDRSHLLLYRFEGFNDISAIVVDVERKVIGWEGVLSPENIILDRDFVQALVSDEGEMFIVLDEDNRKASAQTHRYTIFSASNKRGKLPEKITLFTGGLLTYDVHFSVDNLNRLLLAGGMYFEENPNRAEGHFFLRFDLENRGQPLLTYEPFEDVFVVNLMGQRLNRKNKYVIETTVQQIVHRQDGGMLIIGERNRTFERQAAPSRAARMGYYIIDYYYDDLFIISVHPDGKTHWKAVLPKKQYSQDDGAVYSSYFLAVNPTSLRLLFNDEIKQENTVSEYVVGGNGTFQRNAVLSTQHQDLQLRIRDAMQISADELIIPSERRNRLKLVKVNFD